MQKYNKLKLIDTFKREVICQQTYGKFQCECGNIVEIRLAAVKNGHSRSCGCMSANASQRYARKPVIFFDLQDEGTYYWAGFIFGDGSISQKGNLIQICLSNANGGYRHLQKLSKFVYEKDHVLKYDKVCHLQIFSSIIKKNLHKFGIIPNKTHEGVLRIPDANNAKHFIRGYFDADGWASIRKSKYKGKIRYEYLVIGICSYLKENLAIISEYLPIVKHINKRRDKELYSLMIQAKNDVSKAIKFLESKNKKYYLEVKWKKIWNFVNS